MKSRRLCSTLLHQFFIFPVTETIFDTRVLYSITFVIFPVTKTIFGASGYFPVSQGQEMKGLTASSGHKAMRVNILFQPKCGQKTATSSLYRESTLSTVSFI